MTFSFVNVYKGMQDSVVVKNVFIQFTSKTFMSPYFLWNVHASIFYDTLSFKCQYKENLIV